MDFTMKKKRVNDKINSMLQTKKKSGKRQKNKAINLEVFKKKRKV